nr:restriction endonuclease subunit S [Prevotella sp.]
MRKMKDSGIEWIGKIPETWEVTKLNTLYTQRNEKVSDRDYPPLSVTMKGILPQLETAAKTDNGDDRKLVCIGDFAINSRSDRRGSCGISPYEGSVSLINTILKPRGEMNPNYYNWLFHSSMFSDEFYKWGHGIVDDLWTTRWQEMRNITVPSPTLEVQQHIADYLDEKCGEIDSLIALQEQMIEKLKAYKQSVITEAVTKGLDTNAKLVPSGIDWIGEIPEGWKVTPLKWILRMPLQYGANESGILYDDSLPRYVRITDI